MTGAASSRAEALPFQTQDRCLAVVASASLAALLLTAGVQVHALCVVICLHGETAMALAQICHGAAGP